MERATEWFVAITALVIGCSHIIRAADWIELYAVLARSGRPGAFVNGALSLVPGAALVAGHPIWTWPGVMLTAFGWLLVLKAVLCFLAPDQALQSMVRGPSRAGFVTAGVFLLIVGGWSGYCLWHA